MDAIFPQRQYLGMVPFQAANMRVGEPVHWPTLPLRNTVGKKGRVTNMLMEECSKICTDETWQKIFSKAARGKLPRGFALRETRLSVKIKKKITAITLSLDPQEATKQFTEFVDLYDNIFSDEKNPVPRKEITENAFTNNLAHRKHYRRHMLDAFLVQESSRLCLSQEAYEEACYTLFTGFVNGYFRCKDLVNSEEERRIERVRGFVYSQKTGRFSIHPANFARTPLKKKPTNKKPSVSKDVTASNFMEKAMERQVTEPIQHPPALPEDFADDGRLNLSME